jgi:hypothetical protein
MVESENLLRSSILQPILEATKNRLQSLRVETETDDDLQMLSK